MVSSNGKKQLAGFVAYPSQDGSQAAIIERAILLHNEVCSKLHLDSWKEINRGSSRIISNILQQIAKTDYILTDLSGLNPNVLFETGYAFGKRKRVLFFIQGNSKSEYNRDMARMEMLSGLQINSIQNATELINYIKEFGPDSFLGRPEIEMFGVKLRQVPSGALFLKGMTNHEVALAALKAFQKIFNPVIVDDWTEVHSQPLTWYIENIVKAEGIAALFVNPAWNDAIEVNARFSFVCGLALALGKKVQMIGLPGYQSAFDYKDILKSVESSDVATRIIEETF